MKRPENDCFRQGNPKKRREGSGDRQPTPLQNVVYSASRKTLFIQPDQGRYSQKKALNSTSTVDMHISQLNGISWKLTTPHWQGPFLTTVRDVKVKIAEHCGVPRLEQKLIYDDRVLYDFEVVNPDFESMEKVEVTLIRVDTTLADFVKKIAFADVNDKDEAGWTVLHYATGQNNLKVVKALLDEDRFRKVNTRTRSGNTALHLAARLDHHEIAKALVTCDRFTSVDTKFRDQRTALDLALRLQSSAVARVILESERGR